MTRTASSFKQWARRTPRASWKFSTNCRAMPEQAVKDTLTKSTVKTGLFKRRVIHVARRFGALKKWADFSNVSLQKLITSFEGTPIYEEGLKEVFTKDLDAEGLVISFRAKSETEKYKCRLSRQAATPPQSLAWASRG